MRTFEEFLESRMVGDLSDRKGNWSLVQDAAKSVTKLGIGAAVDYFGFGFAKNVVDEALSQRKKVTKRLQDDAVIVKAKEIIRARISQKAQKRPGNMEAILDSYVSASEESQAFLNDQERQIIIDSIIQAIKNDNGSAIGPGFAQKLVNNVLQQKINSIQNVLNASKPKTVVI